MTEPRPKVNPAIAVNSNGTGTCEHESPTQKRIRKIIAPQFSLVGKRSNLNVTKTPSKSDSTAGGKQLQIATAVGA